MYTYIVLGVIALVVVTIFVRYGSMDYAQKNRNEWGYQNEDIREAEKKK